jgi:hypothetical protein
MKWEFNNINLYNWIVEFHDVHLYYTNDYDETIEYLFSIGHGLPKILNKKYLVIINANSFRNFIGKCLEMPMEPVDKSQFEIQVIQIIEKYSHKNSWEYFYWLNLKLGNLILSNVKYKNLPNLKHIEKQFALNYKFSTVEENVQFDSQIQFLIIMINNLTKTTKKPIVNFQHKISGKKNLEEITESDFNYLDFVFDYWT